MTERTDRREARIVHFSTLAREARRLCSMNICGNKIKAAAYQRRRRHETSLS